MSTLPSEWTRFTQDICDSLNDSVSWCLVGSLDNAPPQALPRLLAAIDGIIASVPGAAQLSTMRVCFTDEESISGFRGCSAVHGFPLMLALADMVREVTYVCGPPIELLAAFCAAQSPDAVCAAPPAALTDAIRAFVERLVLGTEPRALQGQPPTSLQPCNKLGLCCALQAVQCTYRRLVYEPRVDVVTVVYSTRCPCCPEVLSMVDSIVCAINAARIKQPHEPAHDPMWSNACCPKMASEPGALPSDAVANPCGKATTRLRLVVLNIDLDELGPADWPAAAEEQVVPHVRIYPATLEDWGSDESAASSPDGAALNTGIARLGVHSPPPEGAAVTPNHSGSLLVPSAKTCAIFSSERTTENLVRFLTSNMRRTRVADAALADIVKRVDGCREKRMRADSQHAAAVATE